MKKILHGKFNLCAIGGLLVASSAGADVLAGWDAWHVMNANQVATTLAPDMTATMTPSTDPLLGDIDGNWTHVATQGSRDGDFGTIPGADTNSGSTMLARGAGVYLDFTITNTGSDHYDLNAFHLDGWIRWNVTFIPQVTVLSGGGITAGNLPTSAIWAALGATPPSDADYTDDDISLTGLADHTLAAGESVTFRLSSTGSAVFFDNISVTASVQEPPPPPPPFCDISFENPIVSGAGSATNAFQMTVDGNAYLGFLQASNTIDALDSSLNCSQGGAIVPRSSQLWSALRGGATVEVVFKFAMGVGTQETLFSYGNRTGWPSAALTGNAGGAVLTLFYPTINDPAGWDNFPTTLIPDVWHTLVVAFDPETNHLEYSVDSSEPIIVVDPDFRTRTTFFENFNIGCLGTYPMGNATQYLFSGNIKSIRIWVGIQEVL